METTLVLFKPDVFKRELEYRMFTQLGDFVAIYNLFFVSEKHINQADIEVVKEHYIEHKDKPFYNELVDFLMSGKISALVIKGEKAQSLVRKWTKAMRELYSESVMENLIHSSDSVKAADREIALWFKEVKSE